MKRQKSQGIRTRRLTEQAFQATRSAQMRDITGLEDVEQPDGVADIRPYLLNLPESEPGAVPILEFDRVDAVYRNDSGGYDHVLVPCRRSNYYLVLVVDFRTATVFGHRYLDLAEGRDTAS